MRKELYFLVVLCALVSCQKPETPQGGEPQGPHQHTYEIGEYYHNDTLEGIVFWNYGDHNGLMVSLDEVCVSWCVPGNINCLTGATNPYEGWNNTNILMDVYDMSRYPAIQWSYLKNTWTGPFRPQQVCHPCEGLCGGLGSMPVEAAHNKFCLLYRLL